MPCCQLISSQRLFSSSGELGLLSSCGAQASHCSGLGAEHRLRVQGLSSLGSQVLEPGPSRCGTQA